MADKLGNIAGLFKNGRTRAIVLTTLGILVVAIVIGVFSMRNRTKGIEAAAGVSSAPGGIQSVPFEAPNKEYATLQEKQNLQQAQQATQTGTSAIPTIINSGDGGNPPPVDGEAGVGFTALSREQSDAGTFAPKEFKGTNAAAVCAEGKPGKFGTPVYDRDNRLIGYYAGPNITMRDVNGKILCSAGLFGLLSDQNGKLLSSPASPTGTPIYDKNGRLIGYADANGKVRDINGNIVGTVGPDGVVRDLTGKTIGEQSSAATGTPVYDANGNLIGYVGPDGKVRDATGKVVGTAGPDGVVRDINGKVVGSTATPVYDANGKLVGFASADGKVRDANGNIVGSVGPDGVARDTSGSIMGRAGSISPGTPIYDANGNIVGYVGPDGKVRDKNGAIVGTIGVDGVVRDANGNVIGGTVSPVKTTSPAISTPAEEPQVTGPTPQSADAAYERQREIMKDQQLSQLVQQKQQAMSTQANQLLAAWTSPIQQFVPGQQNEENVGEEGDSAGNTSSQASGNSAKSAADNTGAVFIKAGTIYYGIIETAINSDEPGPIMATIVNGDFKGGKLLGSITNQGQAVMITFNTLTLPQFPKSISINAVAIDQNTARTGVSTETNNHYVLRYGSLFAASFVQGYGQALTTAGGTTTSNGLNTQTTTPDLSPTQKAYVALGNVGTQFSNQMNSVYNTPPTVHVAAGSPVGVLFMGDVQLPKA